MAVIAGHVATAIGIVTEIAARATTVTGPRATALRATAKSVPVATAIAAKMAIADDRPGNRLVDRNKPKRGGRLILPPRLHATFRLGSVPGFLSLIFGDRGHEIRNGVRLSRDCEEHNAEDDATENQAEGDPEPAPASRLLRRHHVPGSPPLPGWVISGGLRWIA